MNSKKELWIIIGLLILVVVFLYSINDKLEYNQIQAAKACPKVFNNHLTQNTFKIEKVEGNGNAFGDMAKIYNIKSA